MTSTERRARCACVLAAWLSTSAAWSQTRDDDPRRRQLILQAGVLRDRGDHEGALAQLRLAAARRMSPSLRLFIAQEERALGQHIEALREARLCATEFETDRSLAHRDEFGASCRGIVDDLAARVGRLIVRVPVDTVPGVTVSVRGRSLPADAWGAPWEILPGRALVEADAPGYERFSREVVIAAGASATVRVEMSASDGSARVVAPPRRTRPERESEPSQGLSGAQWGLVAGGGASLALAGIFYGLQASALGDRDALCRYPTGNCLVANARAAQDAADHQDQASTFNTLANVAVGVGVAAIVGGAVWWLAGRGSRSQARPVTTLVIAPSVGGVVAGVRGAF